MQNSTFETIPLTASVCDKKQTTETANLIVRQYNNHNRGSTMISQKLRANNLIVLQ